MLLGRHETTWASLLTYLILFVLPLTFLQTRAQECTVPSSPLLTDSTLLATLTNCTTITGDLNLGYTDCSETCTLSSLPSLPSLTSLVGSLNIACCNELTSVDGFNSLVSISGTLRMFYNSRLQNIAGFSALESVGSIEISQNGNLTSVSGFGTLTDVTGYVQVDHNAILMRLDGLSGVTDISGQSLVAGHALNILFNPLIPDLRWLRNLTQIRFGTVHIEGNTALCYAGYPLWEVGEYVPRPPGGDQGVDWRTLLLSSAPVWQYSWGDGGGGIPTLIIQDNAPYDRCGDASCDQACPEGSGCLGPGDPRLCGSCLQGVCEVGRTPTSASCDPTAIPYWPPNQMPYSLLFGFLFTIIGLILLAVAAVGGWVMFRLCKKLRVGRQGSFDIHEGIESGEVKLIPRGPRWEEEVEEEGGGGGEGRVHTTKFASSAARAEVKVKKRKEEKKKEEEEGSGQVVLLSSTTSASSSGPTVVTLGETDRQRGSRATLTSIPEELEEEEERRRGEGEGEEEEGVDGDQQTSPTRRLFKSDTLTRLKKGESVHIQMDIPRKLIKLKREIGKGDFGTVYYAEAKKVISGEKKSSVVVKELKDGATKQEEEMFLRPVEAMSLLRHPNVLSLLGACTEGQPILILMEYCCHGNLKTFLVRRRREARQVKETGSLMAVSCNMAAGLEYLHSNSIAHNDFAVRNCLVTEGEVVKLGDYGLTKHIFKEDYYSRGAHQKAWPIRWLAPEQIITRGKTVLDSHPPTITGNVWSFGVSLWEVCTFAQWPYFDLSNEEVLDTVQTSKKCALENPFQPNDSHTVLYDIMLQCWESPSKRPSMASVLSQLHNARKEFARNTPSSSTRRKLLATAMSSSPSQIKSKTTSPNTSHAHTTSQRQSEIAAKRKSASYQPRRPAPQLPGDGGSLKRRSAPVALIGAQSLDAEGVSMVTQHSENELHKIAGTGMVKSNPLFEEMEEEKEEREEEVGIQNEDDAREGALYVNPSVEEEESVGGRREEEEWREEEEGEWREEEEEEEEEERGVLEEGDMEVEEEEEEEDNFILEPPIDFSQSSSLEGEDSNNELLSSSAAANLHSTALTMTTNYTSIDEFDQSDSSEAEEAAVEEAIVETSPSIDPLYGGRFPLGRRGLKIGRGLESDHGRGQGRRHTNSHKEEDEEDDEEEGDFSTAYFSERELHAPERAETDGKRLKYKNGKTDEEDYDDEIDSRYRRPTGQIPGMRGSWAHSEGPQEEDEAPSVVYADDVAALIW